MPSGKEEIERANTESVSRMMDSDPVWIDIGEAREKLAMKGKMLLHAGPPIEWGRASGPLRGAVIGASLYEEWAETPEKVERMVEEGEIRLECTHNHNAVGPMAGVISPRMPVYELIDERHGIKAYSNMNEGIGKVLRYGAYDRPVIERLNWMESVMAPVLKATIDGMKEDIGRGLSIKPIIAQALTMGDDAHNRYIATTSLLIRQILPFMLKSEIEREMLLATAKFMNENNFTALNLGMAAAKTMTLAGHGVRHSTIVTVMSRNGTEAGIWLSSLGDKWFTAPAPVPKGLWFPGFSEKDANPDIGDSTITETAGFGGFAMAAAPAIVSWVGGSARSAVEVTNRMYEITWTKHKYFQIPYLDFRGTPTGIDVRKVLRTGISPTINTGIAHRKAGVGQIGAGTVSFPIEVFKKAFEGYVEKYGS
jgi:uncharacterized protein DUF1116